MQPRILLVYNDRALASTMKQAFVPLGAHLVAISEIGKASHLIEEETFDAVLLDGPNLGLAGLALEERLRNSARNHNTEVIVLSDYHHDILRAKLQQGDATFVLDQPFIAEQLRGLLCAGHVNLPPVSRKFVRVPFQTHVLCDTQNEEFTALAETLGEGGIGLLVCGDVTMDTEWVVCFTLPNSTEIVEAKGRVRRTSETQVGLSFSRIRDANRVKIQEYISHHKALITT